MSTKVAGPKEHGSTFYNDGENKRNDYCEQQRKAKKTLLPFQISLRDPISGITDLNKFRERRCVTAIPLCPREQLQQQTPAAHHLGHGRTLSSVSSCMFRRFVPLRRRRPQTVTDPNTPRTITRTSPCVATVSGPASIRPWAVLLTLGSSKSPTFFQRHETDLRT